MNAWRLPIGADCIYWMFGTGDGSVQHVPMTCARLVTSISALVMRVRVITVRMQLFQLILASACFATGGLFMKLSEGVSRLGPTLAFLLLFVVGALLQAFAMRRADLGVAYIAVLGFEAALTALFSVAIFHEHWSGVRVIAVVVILFGVVLLRRS
jgi:multidrug transporter EmrE-like cation transporter